MQMIDPGDPTLVLRPLGRPVPVAWWLTGALRISISSSAELIREAPVSHYPNDPKGECRIAAN
jgi:hypothetical protein